MEAVYLSGRLATRRDDAETGSLFISALNLRRSIELLIDVCDVALSHRCRLVLQYSGLLHLVDWLLCSDVSGDLAASFKIA